MKKYMKTIVPNSRPAYVAVPMVDDNNHAIKIYLEPVVAWQVFCNLEENSESSHAAPVTIPSLPCAHAIYYSDTDMWSITDDDSEEGSGKGIDSLLEYFNRSPVA